MTDTDHIDELVLDIRAAYHNMARHPGAWVGLAAIRDCLPVAHRADVDEALLRFSRAHDVNIVPENNQKTLTSRDRRAAIHIGDQDRHLVAIETR